MEINKFILFLQNIEGIGNGAIRKLIISNAFKSFEPNTLEDVLIWIKNHRDYFAKKTIVDQMTIGKLEEANKKRKIIEEKCNEYGVKYISYFDNMYPRRFKEMANTSKTADFPVILYYLGNLELLNANKICSIIGTREPSDKAKKVGIQASRLITKEGYVVMSGLAEGCDTIGHVGCLDENGKTIAIVGTGLDTVFPKSKRVSLICVNALSAHIKSSVKASYCVYFFIRISLDISSFSFLIMYKASPASAEERYN